MNDKHKYTLEDFEGMEVKYVIRELFTRIEDLEKELLFEEELRRRNPALNEIYKKYITIKELFNED